MSLRHLLTAGALIGSMAGASAARAVDIVPPSYTEAIYGTPGNELVWEAGPFAVTDQVVFHSFLSNVRIVELEIADATPGALVNWYGQHVGFADANGDFSLVTPIIPLADNYDQQQYGVLRVGFITKYGGMPGLPFTLDLIGVTGGPPGASPEPSTWALLLLGFGAAGAVLRIRRGRLVA